jgi:hypothetical protein
MMSDKRNVYLEITVSLDQMPWLLNLIAEFHGDVQVVSCKPVPVEDQKPSPRKIRKVKRIAASLLPKRGLH